MKGDYHRYMAEIATGEVRANLIVEAERSYQKAWEISTNGLSATNPLRLGLALNYSVFNHEIKGKLYFGVNKLSFK